MEWQRERRSLPAIEGRGCLEGAGARCEGACGCAQGAHPHAPAAPQPPTRMRSRAPWHAARRAPAHAPARLCAHPHIRSPSVLLPHGERLNLARQDSRGSTADGTAGRRKTRKPSKVRRRQRLPLCLVRALSLKVDRAHFRSSKWIDLAPEREGGSLSRRRQPTAPPSRRTRRAHRERKGSRRSEGARKRA